MQHVIGGLKRPVCTALSHSLLDLEEEEIWPRVYAFPNKNKTRHPPPPYLTPPTMMAMRTAAIATPRCAAAAPLRAAMPMPMALAKGVAVPMRRQRAAVSGRRSVATCAAAGARTLPIDLRGACDAPFPGSPRLA